MEGNANPSGENSTELAARRLFLERALKLSATVWAAGLSVPAAIYIWPGRREGPARGSIAAGPADKLEVGASTLVKAEGSPILLVRTTTEEIRGYSAICTHLGCLVGWRKEQGDIYCPCHGGRFNLDGKVIGGPPPSPLHRYPVTIVEGVIQIDTRAS